VSTFYFLKLRLDFYDAPEIKVILSMENGYAYTVVYQKLLLLSLRSKDVGCLRLQDDLPYNDSTLSTVLNTDIDLLRGAMKMLSKLGLVSIDAAGTIVLEEAIKLAGKENTSTQRVREFRERQRQKLLTAQTDSRGSEEAHPEGEKKSAFHETFQCNTERERERETDKKAQPSASLPEKCKKVANEYSADFEVFWASYPRKVEKRKAFKTWNSTLKKGAGPADLIVAAKAYAAEGERKGRAVEYIKHPATFLGPNEAWRDFIGSPVDIEQPAGKKCPACGEVAITSSGECMSCGADYKTERAARAAAK